ncbi:hypothetical protein [Streptomyces sp. NPDC088360]|uniref:hypothetical protein n=1 Tax=Streptomyces sp. NPDC088360 TaxID=3154515 RepID=UPI00344C3D51
MFTTDPLQCVREDCEDGHYEVRVPAFFALHPDMSLTFSVLGEEDGMGGVVTDCTECGLPAPRTLLEGLAEAVHAVENKLKELLK